jgi:preprotein translocase subunit SecE
MNNNLVWIIVWAVLIAALFGWLWYSGQLQRLVVYVQQTREELKKCSWPTLDELKGSTVVVFIAIGILGGFTMAVDRLFFTIYYYLRL